ncbi:MULTISPECIES: type II secretion system protein GspL [unclassified Agarivorans]|nr:MULTISPECIES: type II secretion system protein GspL [unclassified Agarivorans]MDO6687536.1 type II secretion system protein GspL [Agarivorans sp. 3_MG-2023]MDO6717131.1 type II secretion system protein GspL [Agarivorans sp. 2_MG-2023]
MNEQLIIRLPSTGKEVINWMVWSDNEQEVIAAGELAGSAELEVLQDKAEHRRVIVLVPTSDVSHHQLELPKTAQRSWQQVAPFMLEEQLAQDPDSLHICLLDKGKETIDVACVSHQQMDSWQDMLEAAGIYSQTWCVEGYCLPEPEEGQASALQINQQWLFRFSDGRAMSIDQAWLSVALPLLAKQYPELVVQHYSPSPKIDIEGIEWQARAPELAMKLLADGAKKAKLNLLQGQYASANPLTKIWLQWRKVAIAAGVCFALALTYQVVDTYKTEQQIAEVDSNIRTVYKKVFPEVSRIRDSRIRSDFRKALAGIGQAPEQDFLMMMVHLASAMDKNTGFQPVSLRFDQKKGEIRLQAEAKNFQSFEQFRQAVQPFETEQGTLSNKAGAVVGTVVIRKAS